MDVIGAAGVDVVGADTAAAGTATVVAGLLLVTAVPDPAVVVVVVEMAVVEGVVAGAVAVFGGFDVGVVDAGSVSAPAAVDVSAGTVDVPLPSQALRLSNNNKLVYFHRDCVGMIRYLCEFSIVTQSAHSLRKTCTEIATDNKHGEIVFRVMFVTAIDA